MGLPLFDKGFVNVTVEKEYGNFTQNGGDDTKMLYTGAGSNGTQTLASMGLNYNGISPAYQMTMPGYPRSNPIDGNPEYQLTMASVNSAYDFSDSMRALCLRHHRASLWQVV